MQAPTLPAQIEALTAQQSLFSKVVALESHGINTYPMATVALVGILTATGLSDINPARIAHQSAPDQWASVHIARMQWAVERLQDIAESGRNTRAPMALECWLARDVVANTAAFVSAVTAFIARGEYADNDMQGGAMLGLDLPLDIAAMFYAEFAEFILEDANADDLQVIHL